MPNHKIAPFPDHIQSRARPCFLAPFPKSPCPSSDLQAPLHPPAEIPKVPYGVWSPWAITPSSAATGVFLMVLAGWRRPVLTCCPAGAPVSPHQLQKCSWQPLGEATGALAPRGALIIVSCGRYFGAQCLVPAPLQISALGRLSMWARSDGQAQASPLSCLGAFSEAWEPLCPCSLQVARERADVPRGHVNQEGRKIGGKTSRPLPFRWMALEHVLQASQSRKNQAHDPLTLAFPPSLPCSPDSLTPAPWGHLSNKAPTSKALCRLLL